MGVFKLGKMTARSLFKKPETRLYPVVQREYFEATKGHIEADIQQCVFDGSCAKRCPTGALVVDRTTRTITVEPFLCIQCGACVRQCPRGVLSNVNTYTQPATQKSVNSWTKELSEEEKAEEERKAAEKAAKIAAAKAAMEAKKKAAAEAAAKAEQGE